MITVTLLIGKFTCSKVWQRWRWLVQSGRAVLLVETLQSDDIHSMHSVDMNNYHSRTESHRMDIPRAASTWTWNYLYHVYTYYLYAVCLQTLYFILFHWSTILLELATDDDHFLVWYIHNFYHLPSIHLKVLHPHSLFDVIKLVFQASLNTVHIPEYCPRVRSNSQCKLSSQ